MPKANAMRTYLDWNATAPLRESAQAAMIEALAIVGNPSSVHAEGRAARSIVERARGSVAELVGCKASEVVFTSGATESASILRALPIASDVIVDQTAHDCLWAHARSANDNTESMSSTLAMGLANSETGVISAPERDDAGWIYGDTRSKWLLLDVVQAIGRVPFSFHWSNADFAIISAHKLGGPKGAGALIVREGVDIEPVLAGGGQELGRRSGTENVAGIAGFGAACSATLQDLNAGRWSEVEKLRNILESALAAGEKETIFVGKDSERLPNTSCFVLPGWKGETQVMQMDLSGFAVSSGSACSSGKVKVPRVLRAMGLDDREAECALRVSLGPSTSEDDVLRFAETWLEKSKKARVRAA